MTKSGFDLDEIERLLAAATPGEWIACGWGDGSTPDGLTNIFNHDAEVLLMECLPVDDAALIVVARNSLPAMLTEIRELRAENARLRGHWSALDKALADNIIETDQPHRVRWEGEWHYGPLADAYFAMIGAVRDCARAALGEPQ